ncbi:MAG: ATP-binding cassette domain-containing protein [Mollicutes bacterium PWAP]|nr:ATP-binding cassette domain-containing protein [Mollicutes bacterium PWAP]
MKNNNDNKQNIEKIKKNKTINENNNFNDGFNLNFNQENLDFNHSLLYGIYNEKDFSHEYSKLKLKLFLAKAEAIILNKIDYSNNLSKRKIIQDAENRTKTIINKLYKTSIIENPKLQKEQEDKVIIKNKLFEKFANLIQKTFNKYNEEFKAWENLRIEFENNYKKMYYKSFKFDYFNLKFTFNDKNFIDFERVFIETKYKSYSFESKFLFLEKKKKLVQDFKKLNYNKREKTRIKNKIQKTENHFQIRNNNKLKKEKLEQKFNHIEILKKEFDKTIVKLANYIKPKDKYIDLIIDKTINSWFPEDSEYINYSEITSSSSIFNTIEKQRKSNLIIIKKTFISSFNFNDKYFSKHKDIAKKLVKFWLEADKLLFIGNLTDSEIKLKISKIKKRSNYLIEKFSKSGWDKPFIENQYSENIININNVTKSFGSFIALHGISFNVKKGERIGLIGANGAGKTTIAEIVVGLNKPTTGTVEYGFNFKDVPQEKMGVQFQQSSYPSGLTVRDLIKFAIKVRKIKINKVQLEWWLNLFQMQDFYRRGVRSLSGGQKQKLNILMSVLHKPKLLILDELSTGLDIAAREDIINFADSLLKELDASAIVISHHMEEIKALCDRLVILDRGRIVKNATIKEIENEYGDLHAFMKSLIKLGIKIETGRSGELDKHLNKLHKEVK